MAEQNPQTRQLFTVASAFQLAFEQVIVAFDFGPNLLVLVILHHLVSFSKSLILISLGQRLLSLVDAS